MSETAKNPTTRKPRTKKVAEETVVENVVIEEAAEATDNVITAPTAIKPSGSQRGNNFVTESGAIGSRAAERKEFVPEPTAKKIEQEKIAIWSDKNIRWTEVGTLIKGYNLVTKEAAEKWLKKGGIREATPEEVATYYSK